MPKRKLDESKISPHMTSFAKFSTAIERTRFTVAKSILDFKFNKARVKVVSKSQDVKIGGNDIVYWMFRDQRIQDNWGLLYSQRLALKAEKPLSICFSLNPTCKDATLRSYNFILDGLKQIEAEAHALNINFHLFLGEPKNTLPEFVRKNNVSAIVCDFMPLRKSLKNVDEVRKNIPDDVPICQIDSHNIVPIWTTSDKQEYAARTIRPKIWQHMGEFFTEFPPVIEHPYVCDKEFKNTNWSQIYSKIDVDENVKQVEWARPGTENGLNMLYTFIRDRLENYSNLRNNPNESVQSNLSPWFHFGQISVQRAMLEVNKYKSNYKESVDAFLEEGIVRRELSDNFCYYQKNYDNIEGASDWAKTTLRKHEKDERSYVYSLKKFESAETHEDLWNAAQKQLVLEGKLHGFLRMYWAKKILEWSEDPSTALRIALYLNDKYSLDGFDPNGYTGCMWSICGIHDQGWKEREIFGKIRYMNYAGCKRKVNDLVQRLTLDELTEQMARGGRTTYAPPITRLNIKPYSWGTECLRGDVTAGPATSFPQALGLAASFSRNVLWEVSRATGLEVRAKFNNYTAAGQYGQHKGASCWSPVINILRDPRWGRNQETYGEDPWMSGELARAFVNGLQGDHPKYIMANAGCKHFDVYAGPENIPESRHQFNAKVSVQDWRQTFLPQFKACVEAGSLSLMCSYNRINGIPACANKFLLTDVLRGEWGFRGYVISDEGAIEDIKDNHHYTNTIPETAAVAVKAGCNLEDGPGIKPYFYGISDAVRQGLLSQDKVREAAKPLFYTRMRLGLFDPPKNNPYSKLKPEEFVQSKKHRYLSLITAMKTFVLLKNNGALPLRRKFNTAAIVGPFADNLNILYGEYSADVDPKYGKTPRQGLQDMANNLKYGAGCLQSSCNDYNSQTVKDAAKDAEVTVVCLGLGADLEGESNDRSNIDLPGKQLQLLKDASRFSPSNSKVIVILFNAGALDVSWAQESSSVSAIIAAWYPAQATGDALFNVLYNRGEASNPAGRLPATWPKSLSHYPNMTDYRMNGRTYRYPSKYDNLYPFGFGLSYTRFHYSSFTVTPTLSKFPNPFRVRVFVANIGSVDGEEVVQIYSQQANVTKGAPKIQLVGFERVFIRKGQIEMVTFQIQREQFTVWQNDRFIVPKGTYTFYVGGQQPMQNVRVPSNVLMQKVMIN